MNRNGGNQSVAKIVKQVLNSQEEKKFYQTSFSSGVDSTMVNHDFTSIPQGTTSSSRIGANIKLRSLKMKWVATLGDSTNLIRVLVFYWKPNDAVDVPQQSELFQNSSILSQPLKINPNRFTLLADLLIQLDTYHPVKTGEINLKLGSNVSFVPGVDTGMNHVYLSCFSDSAGVPNPTFEFVGCVTYTDD